MSKMSRDGDHNGLKRKIEDLPNLVEGSSLESKHVTIEEKSSKRLRVTDGISHELIDNNEVIDEETTGNVVGNSVMISNEENGNITCMAVSHEEIVNLNEDTEIDEESYISDSVTSDENDNMPSSVISDDIDNNVLVTDDDIPNIIDSTFISSDADLSDTISWEPREEDSTIEIVSSVNSFGELEDLDEESDLSFLSAESYSSATRIESNVRVYTEDSPIEESDEFIMGTDMCPICLEKLSLVIGSPDVCEHKFCLGCITEWSKRKNTCPVDRMIFSAIVMVLRNASTV